MANPAYQRILLKLSGEALLGNQAFGIDTTVSENIASQVAEIDSLGVEIAIVIGGGNIFRGLAASAKGMDRATADYMGMLATVMNALALSDAIERHGVTTRVVTAIDMRAVAEPFIRRRSLRHLEKKRVVLFAAGTGNPYFTTDTAAALRAMEIRADVILKGTNVNGIFTSDPQLDESAVLPLLLPSAWITTCRSWCLTCRLQGIFGASSVESRSVRSLLLNCLLNNGHLKRCT